MEVYGHHSSCFRTSQCKKLEKYEKIKQNLVEGWIYSRSKWETVKQRKQEGEIDKAKAGLLKIKVKLIHFQTN